MQALQLVQRGRASAPSRGTGRAAFVVRPSGPRNPSAARPVVRAAATPGARCEAKAKLLAVLADTERGYKCPPEVLDSVEAAVQRLEKINPTPKPLESPLISGKWKLVFTTSQSILGANRPEILRPKGPTYQIIDGEQLLAQNLEGPPFFSEVKADLTPRDDAATVDVQFTWFKIAALIPIKAPESAKGFLKTTYLDEEMRISRGDKGNLFVLLQDGPKTRVRRGPLL
ncbi:unnamed protein product [Pedinophyceae sp. YPF-701]|nr:unnamed protein product [Pedinophyceae sp. YPF-701]